MPIEKLFSFVFLFLKISADRSFPPPLPPEEEKELFLKAKKGDAEARNKLIEHNLRLVAHIVKKYYSSCRDQEDLISIGTIGLIKAIDTFDAEKGSKFATYAGRCLQNEILMYFRKLKKSSGEISINETIDVDKDGNPLTYIDVIAVEDTIADDLDTKIKAAKAMRVINGELEMREKEIIIRRFGLCDKKAATQKEIAKELGISRSYVSRLEKSALAKINAALSDRLSGLFE